MDYILISIYIHIIQQDPKNRMWWNEIRENQRQSDSLYLNTRRSGNASVNLRELAYGSEKAKKLFRDMMQQAQIEFGFEADNIPLMIEAIPVSTESIILIITKVEDPEELDTRFSKFAPFKGNKPPIP